MYSATATAASLAAVTIMALSRSCSGTIWRGRRWRARPPVWPVVGGQNHGGFVSRGNFHYRMRGFVLFLRRLGESCRNGKENHQEQKQSSQQPPPFSPRKLSTRIDAVSIGRNQGDINYLSFPCQPIVRDFVEKASEIPARSTSIPQAFTLFSPFSALFSAVTT